MFIVDPGERLHDWLRFWYHLFMIDDCSASQAMTKKKDTLSELAFSGRHAQQSVWVLSQRYNSVLKDLREQTQWVALFHCKDRDSFEECLRENDVIANREDDTAFIALTPLLWFVYFGYRVHSMNAVITKLSSLTS